MQTDKKQFSLLVMLAAIFMLTLVFVPSPVLAGEKVLAPEVEILPSDDAAGGDVTESLPIHQELDQLTEEATVKEQFDKSETGDVMLGLDPSVAVGSISLNQDERKLVDLINDSRAEAGVSRLALDEKITEIAKLKAKDMVENGYLSYNSRTYGSVRDMLDDAGLEYRNIKPKIARTSVSVSVNLVQRVLMRYESHSEDLLDSRYNAIGIAVQDDGQRKYIVQILVGGGPQEDRPDPQPEPQPTPDPQPKPDPEPQPSPPADNGDTAVMNASERQMLDLVNNERVQRGLQPLKADATLVELGRLKAQDMIEKGYFSHTSPTYGSPFAMMRSAGVQYSYAGENLAKAGSVNSAHNGLMNSSGHRANILNENFNRVGIAVVKDGYYKYFVQMFIRGQGGGSVPQPDPQPEPSPQPTPQPQPEPEPDPRPNPGDTQGLTADEKQMLSLVNKERTSRGVEALQSNLELAKVARVKAEDMIDKGYFSHTSPTYGSPFDMMRQFGIRFGYAGENLAGAPTVSSAHTNLMNSSGHRRNILNDNFDQVGIGVVDGGPYGKMFVQMFIG